MSHNMPILISLLGVVGLVIEIILMAKRTMAMRIEVMTRKDQMQPLW